MIRQEILESQQLFAQLSDKDRPLGWFTLSMVKR